MYDLTLWGNELVGMVSYFIGFVLKIKAIMIVYCVILAYNSVWLIQCSGISIKSYN